MSSYVVRITYDVEADSPEEAATLLADAMDEGLIYRPVCDVYDPSLTFLTRVDTHEDSL
jgi:hypothetical protein